MNDDLQKNTKNKTHFLLSALTNAKSRAEKIEKYLKIIDNRFALFRLISIIALLAVIVNYSQKSDSTVTLTLIILFLVYCLITSWLHNLIQSKEKKWKALTLSYELSFARVQRDFNFISSQKSPWHDECILVPNSHVYSSDLDIHTQLFLLIDTCSTKEGSQKLFSLLMESGVHPEEMQKVLLRTKKSKILSTKTRLLRHFESLRLSEPFLQKYFKLNEKKIVDENNKEIQPTDAHKDSFFSDAFRVSYSIISIIAWAILLVPALRNFMITANTEALLQPLFLYTGFLLVGTLIFSPITDKVIKISQSSKTIQEIVNTLSNNEEVGVSLELSFLKKEAKSKIKSLNLLLDLVSLRGNPIFWITLHIFVPFDAIVCLLLQFKIKNFSVSLENWKKELCEFDIIASFARFASENPTSRFLSENERKLSTTHKMECIHIGHPLISSDKRISNSISLEKNSPVVLLTGSNMAGKSTFLRTLGTNIVLANIGAPVFADKFIVPAFRLFCAIRIDDSLSDGTSYFYAEVKRLHYILNSLDNDDKHPGFFLIDEIFRGTNNKERFIGSWHIIHALFDKNSFGFISTHDLALTELDKNDSRLINMHFREHIEGEQLAFDYLIKEGPCPTTNALYIMKQYGLPVP